MMTLNSIAWNTTSTINNEMNEIFSEAKKKRLGLSRKYSLELLLDESLTLTLHSNKKINLLRITRFFSDNS